MTEEKISIIVPCYNVEQYLAQCVDSILHQTYRNLEVILVDDGSTDSTPRMCDHFAQQDPRVRVIHKENGGLVSARNAGFFAAEGEWVTHVDGDDWIDEDTFEGIMSHARKYPDVDMVFWKCVQELDGLSLKDKWGWKCTDEDHLYTDAECKELARHTLIYKSGIATSYCKLLRREYAQRFGIHHGQGLRQGGEGLEFSIRAFYYAQKVVFANEYYYHYRYNPDSISKRVDEKNTICLTDTFNRIAEDIEHFEHKEVYQEALYQRTVYMLIAIAMSTYFHPNNRDSLFTKCKKYGRVLRENPLFATSVKKAKLSGMDKFRKVTLIIIRMRAYALLSIIARLKQYYLKKGKYNY